MKRIAKPHWWTPQQVPKKVWLVDGGDPSSQLFLDEYKGKEYYTHSVIKGLKGHELTRLTFAEFCIMKMEGRLKELRDEED